MEVERYKMIYTKKITEEMLYEMDDYIDDSSEEEIKSDSIRILGHQFIINNHNKVKLIINNKKYNLKEFINAKVFKNNEIKLNMIIYNQFLNLSCMFQNCFKLKKISINASMMKKIIGMILIKIIMQMTIPIFIDI